MSEPSYSIKFTNQGRHTILTQTVDKFYSCSTNFFFPFGVTTCTTLDPRYREHTYMFECRVCQVVRTVDNDGKIDLGQLNSKQESNTFSRGTQKKEVYPLQRTVSRSFRQFSHRSTFKPSFNSWSRLDLQSNPIKVFVNKVLKSREIKSSIVLVSVVKDFTWTNR